MLTFIAGTSSTGALVAMIVVVSRSSAMPLATLPMKLAVAGATMQRSARSAREMWPISCSVIRLKSSVWTGLPDRV